VTTLLDVHMSWSLDSMFRVPASVKAEPGRAMLGILLSVVIVVSLGDLFLPAVVLFAASFVGGWLARIARQPALAGMLVAGCVARNLFPVAVALPAPWLSGTLRSFSLALIMLRAGLSLEVGALLAQPLKIGLLSALPCLIEVATVATLASWAFSTSPAPADEAAAQSSFSFDSRWGVLLGFCLADVSPAVTVPLLLDLQRLGRGARRGIPSVLIAAASLNAVWAIVGFSITLRLLFADNSSGALSNAGVRTLRASGIALLEVVGGVSYGLAVGWVLSLVLEVAVAEARQRDALRRRLPHTSLPTFGLAGGRRYCPLENTASSHGYQPGRALPVVPGRKYQYTAAPLDSSPVNSQRSIEREGAAVSNFTPQEDDILSSSSSSDVAMSPPPLHEANMNRSRGNDDGSDDDPCAVLHGQFAVALLSAAAASTLAGKMLHLHGGGALGAVCVGIACQAACESSTSGSSASEGGSSSAAAADAATHTVACLNGAKAMLARWWDNVGSTFLFGLLGAKVDLASLEWHYVVLATSIVAAALVPRAAAAYYCAGDTGSIASSSSWSSLGHSNFRASGVRSNLRDTNTQQQQQWTHREKLFAALCWCPKGTVQAALSTLALDAVAAHAGHYPNVVGNVVSFDATEAADAQRAQIVFTVRKLKKVPYSMAAPKCTKEYFIMLILCVWLTGIFDV